jgi:hypothetical protein
MTQSLNLQGGNSDNLWNFGNTTESCSVPSPQNTNNIYTDFPWKSETIYMLESHQMSSTVVTVMRLSEATAHGMREAGVPAAVWWAILFHLSSLSVPWWRATSSRPAGFVKITERCHKTDSLKLRQSPFHFQSHSGTHVIWYHSSPKIKNGLHVQWCHLEFLSSHIQQ